MAERKNRTLIEAVRSMISDSKLPKHFWAEALATANYVLNRSATISLENKTPYEALHGNKPSVGYFRIFGCLSFAHIPKDERTKLEGKSRKCIFIGYSSTTKGYKMYDLDSKKIFLSRDVIFDETKCINDAKIEGVPIPLVVQESVHDIDTHSEIFVQNEPTLLTPELRRSARQSNPPDRYGYSCMSVVSPCSEPSSFKEATECSDSDRWKLAMDAEIASMDSLNVWTLQTLPKDRKVVGSTWVYKKKIGPDGEISSYKARLVAQGYSQQYGIDYQETFSPVIRFESIRTILALSVQHDWKVHQMDVSTAFLNGNMDEDIYMKQPPGYVKKGKEDLVCKLNRSIYGLKQSSRCWYESLNNYLTEIGFEKSSGDACLYVSHKGNEMCLIAVYVDDLLVVSKSDSFLSDVKARLSTRYKMKDLGLANYFLGVNVVQNNDSIFIHQAPYVCSLLEQFNFKNCKPINTPVDTSNNLEKSCEDSDVFDIETYQSAIGSLLYLSMRTRPDIAFAVSNVSKYCSKPSIKHWSAVKRIFRYLNGTIDLGILYGKNVDSTCIGYSDSDWAGDRDDRKSTSGYCFSMSNGLVSWRSNKQPCVALSTAEAEFVALASAAQEAVWLKLLLSYIDPDCNDDSISINEDNQSAICIAKNPKNNGRTKHIDIKYNFIRELINDGKINVNYCPTYSMLADIFTKGLPAARFIMLRESLGMTVMSSNPFTK